MGINYVGADTSFVCSTSLIIGNFWPSEEMS